MPIEQRYVRKTGETRERKADNICELGKMLGGTSNFNIIIGGLDFNILVCHLETRNFVLQV